MSPKIGIYCRGVEEESLYALVISLLIIELNVSYRTLLLIALFVPECSLPQEWLSWICTNLEHNNAPKWHF
jgi:hypothetical protein